MQRNCNLFNLIFLNSEINCQSLECKLNGPQSEVTQQNTNWLEENLIHVEKHSQKSITDIAKTSCAPVIFTRTQPTAI